VLAANSTGKHDNDLRCFGIQKHGHEKRMLADKYIIWAVGI
jgi:hypothetical protein